MGLEYIDITNISQQKLLYDEFCIRQAEKCIDICITTYDRLLYLQKCICSIVASTTVPYRIHVIDDCSTDGTYKFLDEMFERKIIHNVVYNKVKLGTAESLNRIIDTTESNWFVFCNDDMYFHRYWDYASIEIMNRKADCGLISLYNYTNYKKKDNSIELDNRTRFIRVTGLGAAIMYRKLWNMSNKFELPGDKLMGYFAHNFCVKLPFVQLERNKMYMPIPHYVNNMDMPSSKLNEICNLAHYIEFRNNNKK